MEMEIDVAVAGQSAGVIISPSPVDGKIVVGPVLSSDASVGHNGFVQEGLEAVPSEALITVAQIAKVISAVVKPVPWLGPAMEVVSSIFNLCQNAVKNRYALYSW